MKRNKCCMLYVVPERMSIDRKRGKNRVSNRNALDVNSEVDAGSIKMFIISENHHLKMHFALHQFPDKMTKNTDPEDKFLKMSVSR